MRPVERHPFVADVSFDGGDLDCGNGLLLLIRQHMDPMTRGQLLEFRSIEISVDEDFPAWCRMTGDELVSFVRHGKERSFLVCKGTLAERAAAAPPSARVAVAARVPVAVTIPDRPVLHNSIDQEQGPCGLGTHSAWWGRRKGLCA